MPKIGIDIMGGDYAPQVVLEGALAAVPHLCADTELCLVGPADHIKSFLDAAEPHLADACSLIPASEWIGMSEQPVRALQQKPDSSLSIGLKHLANGSIDGFASAGHSGALMVAAMHALGTVDGIDRPCAVTSFPQSSRQPHVLLDVGINVDAKPAQFLQFALLGSIYSRLLYQIENPRIALLNTGSEPGKGSTLYQNAYRELEAFDDINFVGNLEARDFYDGLADVSVCDGFTGNVFLKQAEGLYRYLKKRGLNDPYLEQFNYENYGGTPILGLRGNVMLGHGASSATAIENMILSTEKIIQVKLASTIEKITRK